VSEIYDIYRTKQNSFVFLFRKVNQLIMLHFINNIIKEHRTAMYVRISTSHQQTDRQVIELSSSS